MRLSNILNNVLVEEEETIKNPETGRNIKVSTALSYDPSHPAYKLAKKQSGGNSGEEEKEYDSSGETDYFEYWEDLPDNITTLYDKYFSEEPTFDYSELADIRDEFEEEGWTFDFGLDGDPIDLRPLRDDEKTSTEEPKSTSSEKPKKERPEEAPKRPEDMYDDEHTLEDFREFGNLYSDDMTPEQKDEYDNLTGELESANANLIGAQEDGNDQDFEEAAAEYNEIESKLYDLIDSIYESENNENTNMKISKSRLREIVKEVIKEESEYQKFFKRALEKAGKSIPSMSDEEKKEFFNKIDAAWKGKGEKAEGNEFGAERAKAIAAGEDTFSVDGKEFPVTGVDDEDKENAKAFVGEARFGRGDQVRVVDRPKYVWDKQFWGKAGYIKNIMGKDILVTFPNGRTIVVAPKDLEMVATDSVNEAKEVEVASRAGRIANDVFNDSYRKVGKQTSTLTFKFNKYEDYQNFVDDLKGAGINSKDIKESVNEETINEGPSSEEIRMAQKAVKQFAKYRRVSDSDAYYDLLNALKAIERQYESINEGKDDFVARHGKTNIFLKKGYKHHNETDLENLYDKLGKVIKGLKVKDINVVFESVEDESINEGRGFVAAAKKAKDEGKTEFEYKGKTYPVTLKESSKLKDIINIK